MTERVKPDLVHPGIETELNPEAAVPTEVTPSTLGNVPLAQTPWTCRAPVHSQEQARIKCIT